MFITSATKLSLHAAILSLLVGNHLCFVSSKRLGVQDNQKKTEKEVADQERELAETGFSLYAHDVNINDIRDGLEELRDQAALFTPDAASDALDTILPFIGKSFNELIGGSAGKKASKLLDLTEFVDEAIADRGHPYYNLTDSDLQDDLTAFLFDGTKGILLADSCSGSSSNAVDLTKVGDVLTINFCANRKFERFTEFNAKGFLDALDGFVEIDTTGSGSIALNASLSFSASVEIDLTSPSSATITIDPLIGELSVDAAVAFVVALVSFALLDMYLHANEWA